MEYNNLMYELLRDQASIMRAMADELDSVADALIRAEQTTVPEIREELYTPNPIKLDGTPPNVIDVTYNVISPNIDKEVSVRYARKEAREGKSVAIDFGHQIVYLNPNNWDKEITW